MFPHMIQCSNKHKQHQVDTVSLRNKIQHKKFGMKSWGIEEGIEGRESGIVLIKIHHRVMKFSTTKILVS